MGVSEQERMALFRYQVILPLLDGALTTEAERQIKYEILEKKWEYPDGTVRPVKPRVLRYWLEKHRQCGFDGLFYGNRKVGKTKGSCKIPEGLLKVATELREEEPRRSVESILRIMQEGKGLDVSDVHPRTLMRHFKRLGLKKGKRQKGQGQHERYEQLNTNDMWHGDTAHTFMLPDPLNPGQVKKAKLVVLVDDASRVCPHGEFYFDERLPSVLDAFGKALLSRGKPKRILLDNAKTFRSTTLELMCAEFGIGLNFCRPRRPQGKGKIERFIRTIKQSFILEAQKAANITTLDELNAAFQGWLEGYGSRAHEELEGLTPEQRWQKDAHRIERGFTEAQILKAMMLREQRTVHMNTALISLENREYQVSRELAGQEVQIRWNPERLDQIEIWREGRYLETAAVKDRKPHVTRDWREDATEETATKLESSTQYCAALMGDRVSDRVKARHKNNVGSVEDFLELLLEHIKLGRPLEDGEIDQVSSAFSRLRPIDRAATEQKLTNAVEEKGPAQHVRFYLERLEPKAFRR